MMLSGEKRDDSPPSPKRARPEPRPAHASSSAHAPAAPPTPYSDLQRAVHNALENKTAALSTADKVALALEVLRARQLELDLAQARSNIEALVTRSGSAPRTLRAVIPASTVKGLPVGTPVDIAAGKFLLSPTTNDPQALFLTLELQSFGQPPDASDAPDAPDSAAQLPSAPPAASARPPRDRVSSDHPAPAVREPLPDPPNPV